MAERLVIRLGTAGWSVPKQTAGQLVAEGSHLERYASRVNSVEVNSSFYRSHRRKTYERWAAMVPEDFRFSVKVPQSISHVLERDIDRGEIDRFADEISGLGLKLGILLLQFPAKRMFVEERDQRLFALLADRFAVPVVFEPRHVTWFTDEADTWLMQRRIARVAADPARVVGAELPGGWRGLSYFRLHGSPRIYYSSYAPETLRSFELRLCDCAQTAPVWCIFDNTAEGAALENLFVLQAALLLNDGAQFHQRERSPS